MTFRVCALLTPVQTAAEREAQVLMTTYTQLRAQAELFHPDWRELSDQELFDRVLARLKVLGHSKAINKQLNTALCRLDS